MGLRTAALVLLIATSLTACGEDGASTVKAKVKELIVESALKEQYDALIDDAMQGYSPRFLEVMDEDIRKVVEDKLPFEELKTNMIDSYAARLRADEIDAALRARYNPEQAQSIMSDTPEGRGFSDKIVEAYLTPMEAFENEFKVRDRQIVDVLNDMNTNFDR